ncbi:Transcriptional regulator [Carbonactinospora thermoautotrophica]|uniref:Transcriptional regulator n=1 Tax=Carbonactinospora thermoautotrophica TaxID=1469144 RepID=A0A132MUI5_9ACTN|nr:LysR family transcriptional regulator [Carbonactinospora thermoautotrophica]KWX01507.1 Transcriptional regulator [Carbonactinospora thermoautotrophica]
MELRHVRYFVAVAEEQSFTRAAERLRIAQSPLSQQIRKLERELGVELFVRTTRSVQLTHAGRVFYERARHLLVGSDEAITATRKAARGELGRLSLGFTGSVTYELLPALVRAYHERNPDVTLDLHSEMLTPAQVEAILEGRIAVGLLRPPVNAKGLVVEVLREEPLGVLLPTEHPAAAARALALESLHDEIFVGYPSKPPSTMHSVMLSVCRQAGFIPRICQEAAETATLVALVAAGLGMALVPASVQHLRIDGATYRPICSPRATVQLALAYQEGEVTPLVRRYLETARSVVLSRQRTPAPAPAPSPLDEDESFSLSL